MKGTEAADEPEEEQFLQEEITPRSQQLQERLRLNMEVAYFYVHLRTACAVRGRDTLIDHPEACSVDVADVSRCSSCASSHAHAPVIE